MSEQEKKEKCKILPFPVPQPNKGLVTDLDCGIGSFSNRMTLSAGPHHGMIPVSDGNISFGVGVVYGSCMDMDEFLKQASQAYAETDPSVAEKFTQIAKMIKAGKNGGVL